MKQIITTVSLLLMMANVATAQQTTKTEKNTAKKETTKEPCFVSEFDADGKETKVPCDTKTKAMAANPVLPTVTVNSEHDPATGAKKHYIIEYDPAGRELKNYGNFVENFDAAGKSHLFFKYKTAVGKEVIMPAKEAK